MSSFSYVNPVVWQSTVFSINVSFLLLRNISNYFSQVPVEMTKMFKWRVDNIGLIFKIKPNILETFTQLMDCYQYQGTTKYKYMAVFATQFMPFYAIPLEVRTMKQVYTFLRHQLYSFISMKTPSCFPFQEHRLAYLCLKWITKEICMHHTPSGHLSSSAVSFSGRFKKIQCKPKHPTHWMSLKFGPLAKRLHFINFFLE